MSELATAKRGSGYRIDRPTMRVVLGDMRVPSTDPGPGDRLPRFELPTIDGGCIDNEELRRDGRPVLLVFGSRSCPVTESAAPGLRSIHDRHGARIRVVVVNVREAHPGARLPQPATLEEKFEHAVELGDHHGFEFEVAVDDLEGSLHRWFGPRPSSAYLVEPDGRIVFRAHWANVTDALEEAVAAVAVGEDPPRGHIGHTARAMVAMTGHADDALRAAGSGAHRDTWRAASPFGAMIAISRLFRFLEPRQRGRATMALLAGLVLAGTVIAVLAL